MIEEPRILVGRRGAAHAWPGPAGTYALCSRKVETCKACATFGVPVAPPDPFDVASDLMLRHWSDRWYENYRPAADFSDDAHRLDIGMYVYVVTPQKETVVIAQFGDQPDIETTVSALVYAHNKAIGAE